MKIIPKVSSRFVCVCAWRLSEKYPKFPTQAITNAGIQLIFGEDQFRDSGLQAL